MRAPLKPLDTALAELLAQATLLPGADTVATFDADGRVLLHSATSPLQVPPQDNSAMDGYALRCADMAAPGAVLPVSQRIAAGSAAAPLQPGTAARIFTGAPVPPGADAVLMQEDCEALEDGRVRAAKRGQDARRVRLERARLDDVLRHGLSQSRRCCGVCLANELTHDFVAVRIELSTDADGLVVGKLLRGRRLVDSRRLQERGISVRLEWRVFGHGESPCLNRPEFPDGWVSSGR